MRVIRTSVSPQNVVAPSRVRRPSQLFDENLLSFVLQSNDKIISSMDNLHFSDPKQ
jgi:hypothetical protein